MPVWLSVAWLVFEPGLQVLAFVLVLLKLAFVQVARLVWAAAQVEMVGFV